MTCRNCSLRNTPKSVFFRVLACCKWKGFLLPNPLSPLANRECNFFLSWFKIMEKDLYHQIFLSKVIAHPERFLGLIYILYLKCLFSIYIKNYSLKINIFGQSCSLFKKTSILMYDTC